MDQAPGLEQVERSSCERCCVEQATDNRRFSITCLTDAKFLMIYVQTFPHVYLCLNFVQFFHMQFPRRKSFLVQTMANFLNFLWMRRTRRRNILSFSLNWPNFQKLLWLYRYFFWFLSAFCSRFMLQESYCHFFTLWENETSVILWMEFRNHYLVNVLLYRWKQQA